jgi:hypothetical protein
MINHLIIIPYLHIGTAGMTDVNKDIELELKQLLILWIVWSDTVVTMQHSVLWDVTPCGSCKNRSFGGN